MDKRNKRARVNPEYLYYRDDYSSDSDSFDDSESSVENNSESGEDNSEAECDATEATIDETVEQSNEGEIFWRTECHQRPEKTFSGNPGVQIDIERPDIPINVFESFFTMELAMMICCETNRYAEQFLQTHTNLPPNSRVKKWYNTNPEEIMLFICFLLLQGIVQLPTNAFYFSKRQIINCDIFNQIFSEKRFHLLLKFLHFNNNDLLSGYQGPKRLFKIQPIVDYLRMKYKQIYKPDRNISIDESLLLWKGRLGWKVYIPSKSSKYGIKSFVLCESATGYCYDFFFYLGIETVFNEEYENLPYGEKAVMQLISPLLNQGYICTMDNWFSSIPLFTELSRNYTDAIGTIRSNRIGIPLIIKEKKLKLHNEYSIFNNELMIMKNKDRKDIYFLSTIFYTGTVTSISHNKEVVKPKLVSVYNNTMEGVDLCDSILSSYICSRKRIKKYYQKQFRHLLDITSLNSYIIFQKLGGKETRLEYLLKIIEGMIEKYSSYTYKPLGRKPLSENPIRLTGRHFPVYIHETERKKNSARRCQVHKQLSDSSKHRKETRFMCNVCKVPLCAVPCFEIYHTKKDLKHVDRYFIEVTIIVKI